jgi:hypothetical protein
MTPHAFPQPGRSSRVASRGDAAGRGSPTVSQRTAKLSSQPAAPARPGVARLLPVLGTAHRPLSIPPDYNTAPVTSP